MDRATLAHEFEASSNIGGPFLQSAQTGTKCLEHSLDSSEQQPIAPVKSSGNAEIGNALDECIHQLVNLELDENNACGYQDKCKDPIVAMHTKLQKIQKNRDASDIRLKDAKNHVEDMEKMLHLLEEVQVTKRCGDQRLQKTEEEALLLNRRIKSLEKILNECHRPAQCLHNSTTEKTNGERRPLNLPSEGEFDKELELRHNKNHQLPCNPAPSLNQECVEVNKEKSVENIIDCIGQEMAVLSDNLSSPMGSSLILKLNLLKKLIEKRLLLHESQVIELKKTMSWQEKKFFFLEECITCLQSQLLNAQEEKAKIFKQKIEDSLKEKMVYSGHQQNDLQKEMKALRGELTMTCEQLYRAEEEKTCLQAFLDQSTQERRKSQEPQLAESKMEQMQQVSQQHLASMSEAPPHRSSSHNLHQQNFILNDQLNHLKLEIVHLKAELDHCKMSLAACELEKCKLQADEADHVRRVHDEILVKQQLSINLEKQSLQLLTLTEEHKELQRLYSCKIKECEGVVLQLQSHLKHVQTEMDQVKCTLRTLKQKEDHGFQVARSMQKEIITRRIQIKSLQCKIQHLEETKENLCQEISTKNKHHYHELALVQTEKKQLSKELEAEKSMNNYLREQIRELEAVYQMSGSYACWQEFIQLQEQEYYRLKLKHVLDLKQVRPSSSLGSLFGKQHGAISKKHRPHTSSVCRRRSALERVQSTAFSCNKTEAIGGIQRRKHSGSKSHLKTNELQHIFICQEPLTSNPAATTTSPELFGRRSPVHILLTSNPNG